MLKNLFALVSIPFWFFYYTLEWMCAGVVTSFGIVMEGAELGFEWMEKLPWPRLEK